MGARINFVFDDGTDSLVNLYSHWGESNWKDDLVHALVFAIIHLEKSCLQDG